MRATRLLGFARAPSFLFGLVVACGGEVSGEADLRDEGESAMDAPDDGAPAPDETGTGDAPPGDLALQECELGFVRGEDAQPCNWLAENRCYESKALACNCVCPKSGASLCLSDFYGGEGSETKVTCH